MSMFDKALSAIGLQKKSISTNDPYLALLLGGTIGQVSKPYGKIPSVYQSIKAIIDNVAQVKIVMEDRDGQITNDYEDVLKLFRNVYDTDGQRLTFTKFMQTLSGYHSLNGESFLYRDIETEGQISGTKLPNSLRLINPKQITADTNTTTDGFQELVGWKLSGGKTVPYFKIIQIKDFNPYNSFRGLSPIDVLNDQLRIETASSETQVSTLENDATPGLSLETDKSLSPVQRDEIRKGWESRHKGAKNSGKVALLEGGLKANRLGFSNVEMDLINLINSVDDKITGTWRTPKAMFGRTDDINYATFVGQLRVFWKMTIIPLLKMFEDSFNSTIVLPYTGNKRYLRFDLSEVEALQDNIDEYADAIVKMTGPGLFTRNELNERYDLGFKENKEWGDINYVQFSMIPAGSSPVPTYTEPEKSVKKKEADTVDINGLTYTKAQVQFIKNFNNLHDAIHKRFSSDLRGYFNGLRKRVLDSFDNLGLKTVNKQLEINIGWDAEKDLLYSIAEPHERDAMEQGVKVGEQTTGRTSSDRLQYNISNATKQRLDFMSGEIINTTRDKINESINRSVDAGDSVDDIKRSLKDNFNFADNRAANIARTEITAQLNGGLLLQYDDVGVEYKEWLTNIDGFERDSHRLINHETVKADKTFSNGLMFPGDYGPPEETINCRCSVLPALGG